MRNSSVTGEVVSGHPDATEAARKILSSGAKAADAACSCLLMLTVTKPGATCLGGEVPVIVYDSNSEQTEVLCGLGTSPANTPSVETYQRKNRWIKRALNWYRRGIYDAATPALLHVCVTLLIRHGSLSFQQISEPVLAWLQENKPTHYRDSVSRKTIDAVTGKTVRADKYRYQTPDRPWWQDLQNTLLRLVDAEQRCSGSREVKLQAVIDEFYRGETAEKLASWYQRGGALLTYEDLERHDTRVEEAVSVSIGELEVLKCGQWTQGPIVSQALKMLADFELRQNHCRVHERVHLTLECTKLAMADRFRYFGDPDFNPISVESLLADDYIDLRRDLVSTDEACPPRAGDPAGKCATVADSYDGTPSAFGTTTCVVSDRFGNVIVATPSGCGNLAGAAGDTGIVHGARLNQFTDAANHPNSWGPSKRPCITPSPTLVLRNKKPVLAASITWGNYQDQLALQLIVELISHGYNVDSTLDSRVLANPILLDMPLQKNPNGVVSMARPDNSVSQQLTKRGHNVVIQHTKPEYSTIFFDYSTGSPRVWRGA